MERPKIGYFYLACTIFLWSTTAAVAKIALNELDNYQLVFYMNLVSVMSLLIVNFFQGKLGLFSQYKVKDYLVMFCMGFVGIFLYSVFLYGAFYLAPAGQVNVVNYLWPAFVIIFSIPVLQESFNYRTAFAVAFSFVGAFVAFTQGNIFSFSSEYTKGYLLAALGAVCYGLFSVFGKKLKYDKFSSMLIYYLSATVFIAPISILVSNFKIPQSPETIVSILFLGGLVNSLAFVFWFKALETENTHKVANLVYGVPFLSMVWTYFLNGEQFSIASVLGLILIVLGILVQFTNKQSNTRTE